MTAITQADREAAASGYFAWCSGNPVIPDKMRAELVAEIVAWLNVRAGQVLQLHAEAKTDHERNIVDEHSSAIEQCAIEIEAKFGERK